MAMIDPALLGVLMTLGLNLLLPATVVLLIGWAFERVAVALRWADASTCQRATVTAVLLLPAAGFVMNALGPGAHYVAMPEPVNPGSDALGVAGWSYLVLSLVWFVGAVALWSRLIGGLWWTRRLVKDSRVAGPAWRNRVQTLAARHGFTAPSVRTSTRIAVPCVTGFRFPVLMLPDGVKPTNDMDGVLIHELSHLQRRDPFWTLLTRALTATFWVHPLVWRLDNQAGQTAEQACDDEAIRRTGDAVAYTRALLRFAECGWRPPRYAGVMAAGLVSSPSWLRRRIHRMLQPGAVSAASTAGRSSRRRGLALTVVVVGLALAASNFLAIHHTSAAAAAGYAWLWCATP